MPAKKKRMPLADDVLGMLEDLMPVPALTDEDVDPLQLLIDAPAEEFQKALSEPLRKLVIAGLRNMPAPKSYKELASAMTMFEKAEGLNKTTEKNTMPVGMVVPLRHVQRRIGSFPEPPQPAPTLLELEADLADQTLANPPPPESATATIEDDFEV